MKVVYGRIWNKTWPNSSALQTVQKFIFIGSDISNIISLCIMFFARAYCSGKIPTIDLLTAKKGKEKTQNYDS